MDKILIRKKVIPSLSSNFIYYTTENDCKNIKEYIAKYGFENILSHVFEENLSEFEDIQKNYKNALQTKLDNEYFRFVYKYNDKFCISIDNHINLYRIDHQLEVNGEKFLEWNYPELEKYLADSWWFEDKEILYDIQNLNLIEFLAKYKGI